MNIAPAAALALICARIVGREGSPAPRNYAIGALAAVIGDDVNKPEREVTDAEIDRALAEVGKRRMASPPPADLAGLFGDDSRDINSAEAALAELRGI